MADQYQQNQDQVIAALMAADAPQFAQPTVDPGGMMGGGGRMMPGQSGASQLGGVLGDALMGMEPQQAFTSLPDVSIRNTPGAMMERTAKRGQKQAQEMQEGMINRAIPQDMLMAQADYMQAGQNLQNTQTRRFRGGIFGLGESVYDMFKHKNAKKEFIDARQDLDDRTMAYQANIEKQKLDQFKKERTKYVNAVVPLLETKIPMRPDENPEVYGAKIEQLAVQGFNEGLSIEKMFPNQETSLRPVPYKYIDPATGAQMEKYIDPTTGNDVKGPNFAPRMIAAPSTKTTGEDKKWMLTYDADGNEFQTQMGPPGADGESKVIQTIPTGKNIEAKPLTAMSSENKKYAPMLANSTTLVSQALPVLFDPETGNWNGIRAQVPASKEKAALLSLKNAIRQSIRPESGAAVPESEVEAAEEMYLPNWHDSDLIAQSKIQRFAEYQKRMYDSMFSGYTDIPENLMFVDYIQPWMDTPAAQAAAQVNALEDADAALTAQLEAALKAAQEGRR